MFKTEFQTRQVATFALLEGVYGNEVGANGLHSFEQKVAQHLHILAYLSNSVQHHNTIDNARWVVADDDGGTCCRNVRNTLRIDIGLDTYYIKDCVETLIGLRL